MSDSQAAENASSLASTDAAPSVRLSPEAARVLGTLMEKARTVPDSYPLTLNTLVQGCNQKTSRDPIMELTEADVAQALDDLRGLGLVHEVAGSRTAKFTHNMQRGLGVYEQASVLLGMLMLRGPQTAGELRLNTERWYKFADISSVEGFLEELQDRPASKGGPLVVLLPRAPGAREQRWAHLLCGPVDSSASGASGPSGTSGNSAASAHGSATSERIHALEQQVAQLQRTVDRLCSELGLSPDAAP